MSAKIFPFPQVHTGITGYMLRVPDLQGGYKILSHRPTEAEVIQDRKTFIQKFKEAN